MKKKSTPKGRSKTFQSLNKLKNYLVTHAASLRNRLFVFLVFVFLSLILWFYRTLDDTFIANINYPVRYQNFPQNKILVGTPPQKVRLRVRGNGYNLLSNKLKLNKKNLNFNINSFLLYSQANDSMSVYILTQYAREALTDELNIKSTDLLEIISIEPDTIFFSFTRTKAKKVPVLANIYDSDNIFARQHMLNGNISTTPELVDIIGPATIVDTINAVYTKTINPTELTDTFTKRVNLIPINQVRISEEKVNVRIPVDRFTQIGYEIPIHTKYVPDSINMKLFPRKVKLSFNITHSNIPKASELDFRPYIDYRELSSSGKTQRRLQIRIDSVPVYVKALRLNPTSVEYINEIKHD